MVTVVITAHVNASPPYNLPVGKAKPKRRKEYDEVDFTTAKWECKLANGTAVEPVAPVVQDGDKHSLVVHCPFQEIITDEEIGPDGRLLQPIEVVAKRNGRLLLGFKNVHPCIETPVPMGLELGACTMVGDMQPLNAAKAAASWTQFMLASGFGFVALYLDPTGQANDFAVEVEEALAPELAAKKVVLILFHTTARVAFETQTAEQMHCHWRFRGHTKWLAQLDIDEFLQPLGKYRTLQDVLLRYENGKGNVAALQVQNKYWDHHPVNESHFNPVSHDVSKMVWRDARKPMHGREKLLYRPDLVDYIAVHRVTRGGKMVKPDSETEIRHNHFSRHFKGTDGGTGCGGRENKGAHCEHAMKSVVQDFSFQKYFHEVLGL
jgi:hypothetical protein